MKRKANPIGKRTINRCYTYNSVKSVRYSYNQVNYFIIVILFLITVHFVYSPLNSYP